jgi:hypothetical protein
MGITQVLQSPAALPGPDSACTPPHPRLPRLRATHRLAGAKVFPHIQSPDTPAEQQAGQPVQLLIQQPRLKVLDVEGLHPGVALQGIEHRIHNLRQAGSEEAGPGRGLRKVAGALGWAGQGRHLGNPVSSCCIVNHCRGGGQPASKAAALADV